MFILLSILVAFGSSSIEDENWSLWARPQYYYFDYMNRNDHCSDICPSDEGGVIMSGNSWIAMSGHCLSGEYFIKVINGSVSWELPLHIRISSLPPLSYFVSSVVMRPPLSDPVNYVAAGSHKPLSDYTNEHTMMRLTEFNNDGDLVTYRTLCDGAATDIIQASDGCFFVCGIDVVNGLDKMVIVKVSEDLQTVHWVKYPADTFYDESDAFGVYEVEREGNANIIAICGSYTIWSDNSDTMDRYACLVCVDAENGNHIDDDLDLYWSNVSHWSSISPGASGAVADIVLAGRAQGGVNDNGLAVWGFFVHEYTGGVCWWVDFYNDSPSPDTKYISNPNISVIPDGKYMVASSTVFSTACSSWLGVLDSEGIPEEWRSYGDAGANTAGYYDAGTIYLGTTFESTGGTNDDYLLVVQGGADGFDDQNALVIDTESPCGVNDDLRVLSASDHTILVEFTAVHEESPELFVYDVSGRLEGKLTGSRTSNGGTLYSFSETSAGAPLTPGVYFFVVKDVSGLHTTRAVIGIR